MQVNHRKTGRGFIGLSVLVSMLLSNRIYILRMGSEKQNSSSGITGLMKIDLLQEQSSGPIDSVKA